MCSINQPKCLVPGRAEMSATDRQFRFEPEWRITLFTVLMVPVMAGLGFWQLQRAEEKAAIGAAFERRQQQTPANLAGLWNGSAEALAYLPVRLAGEFMQEEYFLLDNRVTEGRFGYEVVGILELDGGEGLVLVNRGWVPGDPARLEQPAVPPVSGHVTLTGQVYVAPGTPYLLAEQQLDSGWPKLLQAIEMDRLAPLLATGQGVRVFPYPVRIDAGQPGALSVSWKVVNVSPEKHRGYAVQWFVMAACLTVLYLLRCTNLWQLMKRH